MVIGGSLLGRTLQPVWDLATRPLRPLPDFIVIGAQKAGTTSLHKFLRRHPDVTASRTKEVHYFDSRTHLGDGWYRSQFPVRRLGASTPLAFETSPRYLFHPHAPERIKSVVPDVKLIALLRNPVDRAASAHQMEVARGREPLGLLEALQAEESRLRPFLDAAKYDERGIWDFAYKMRGIYADQLSRYFDSFDRAQILVVRSEDLFADPDAQLRTITTFLGIREMPDVGEFPRVRPGGVRGERHMPLEAAEYLNDYFAPHNRRLEELLGRPMW